jgi:hypothetical protein
MRIQGKLVVWKILLLFILLGSDPTYFPANFHCSISVHTFVDSAHLFSPIRVYFDFSYIYHCIAQNSSVLFWTQNRLDQIKVIARAHPCHYFHSGHSSVASTFGSKIDNEKLAVKRWIRLEK